MFQSKLTDGPRPALPSPELLLVCLKTAANHCHHRFPQHSLSWQGLDPHLPVMRKSLVQKKQGGGLCVSLCMCVWCTDEMEKQWKPGQGQSKGTVAPPPPERPVGLCSHPAHLSVFNRPPLPPLIRMELIWPYSSFHGWLVFVFPPHSCWFPESNRSALSLFSSVTRIRCLFGVFFH